MNNDCYIIESPLEAWPGEITVPCPNKFTGIMWQDWRKAIEDCEATSINRLYCYAGLKFIEKHGTWNMDITLVEVQSWEKKPAEELMMLVSWIGKHMQRYMNKILDPKG